MKNRKLKRIVKSSVFTHLFSISKYRKELYLCFHPRDRDVTCDDIKTYTISSILMNTQVNDLGLLVKDVLLVLVEAQSIWTLNIIPRMLEYLTESYNKYIIETKQNIYGTKKVKLPKPELYVLYTGDKVIDEKIISFKKEFFDYDCPIDIIVNVITLNNSSNIIREYIEFTKIFDNNRIKYGYTEKSINDTIDYCIKHNILKEYLSEYGKEVYSNMICLNNQKAATYMYGVEKYEEGIEQGIEQGKLNLLISQFNDKKISAQEAADYLGVSVDDFLKLVNKQI